MSKILFWRKGKKLNGGKSRDERSIELEETRENVANRVSVNSSDLESRTHGDPATTAPDSESSSQHPEGQARKTQGRVWPRTSVPPDSTTEPSTALRVDPSGGKTTEPSAEAGDEGGPASPGEAHTHRRRTGITTSVGNAGTGPDEPHPKPVRSINELSGVISAAASASMRRIAGRRKPRKPRNNGDEPYMTLGT